MKVSVVTPCYNSDKTIKATIQSIQEQTYPHIEHIVMDGGSSDGTVTIARAHEPRIHVYSERDRGQSDAINKGWRLATGDILTWLNADDQYFPDTINRAVRYFEANPEAMWLYGNVAFIDSTGAPFQMRHNNAKWDYTRLLQQGNFIPQPSTFLRREVIEEFGYLREDLHYVMDHEYWLRIGRTICGHWVPEVRSRMIRTREAKTEAGGIKRMHEIEAMLSEYGYQGIPSQMRSLWTQVHLEDMPRQIRRGHLRQAMEALRGVVRYPGTLPKALGKALLYQMPYSMEVRLRGWLVKKDRPR